MKPQGTKRKSVEIVAFAAAACAALAAAAITKDEWEADNSLIPNPSTGAFYVVAPTARTGAQTVDADSVGLDATPTERTYGLPFETQLSTHAPGFICIIK